MTIAWKCQLVDPLRPLAIYLRNHFGLRLDGLPLRLSHGSLSVLRGKDFMSDKIYGLVSVGSARRRGADLPTDFAPSELHG